MQLRIRDEHFAGQAREVEFDSAEHERARDLLVSKHATVENDLSHWRATAFPVAITLQPDPA